MWRLQHSHSSAGWPVLQVVRLCERMCFDQKMLSKMLDCKI